MTSPILRALVVLAALVFFIPLSASADSGGSDNDFNKEVSPEQVTAAYKEGYQRMKAGQYPDDRKSTRLNSSH